MEPKQNKRIAWLDMAKGYGILFVILGHLETGALGTWIYTFHMPLFFFLSGYVFKEKDSFATLLKKKSLTILVPYLALGIPMLAFRLFLRWQKGKLTWTYFLDQGTKFLIQSRTWTLWFLTCLFVLTILFYVARRLLKKDLFLAILSVLLVAAGSLYYQLGGKALPWNIDVCPMAFGFYFAGYYVHKHSERLQAFLMPRMHRILTAIGALILNLGCGFLTHRLSGAGLDMFHNSYGIVPLTYLSAFGGIVGILLVARAATWQPIRYMGENSMLYFAWHQTIMIPISTMLLDLWGFTLGESAAIWQVVTYKAAQLVIILLALTVMNLILTHTPLRVIVGKKSKK